MTASAPRVAFGARLPSLREATGMSQEAFARHVEKDRTYVSGLERGRRNPTLDVLVSQAAGLSVTVSKLVSMVDVPDVRHRQP